MGATKTDLFTAEQNDISTLLKAIAHPARIAILEYLIKVDTCICGDIVNEIHLAQPTISQHLKELKNAGLIKGSIEGTSVCYCVNKETLTQIQHYFMNLSTQIENKSNQCC